MPMFQRQEQGDHCDLEASLAYRTSSRIARATQINLVSKKRKLGIAKMAQWLRALTALSEVLSLNPSNHVVAYNHL